MFPFIEIKDKPLNEKLNFNDVGFEDNSTALYHAILSDGMLKVLMTIEWRDPSIYAREFEIVRFDRIYLHGLDDHESYPVGEPPYSGGYSSDPTIMPVLFNDTLARYGIIIQDVVMHSLTSFETLHFEFADAEKVEKLKAIVNAKFIKSKDKL